MSPGFDLPAEVAAGVMGRDNAMRFVARFAEATGPWPIDGYSEADLAEAEQRLGFRLPVVLRDLYRTVGRRHDLFCAQDRLLGPHELEIDSSGLVLQFRVENQAVAWWGIPIAATKDPDPPVVFRLDREWRPFLGRLSVALVEMLLSEWIIAGNHLEFADNRELDDDVVRTIESTFARLPLPDYPLWADPEGTAGVRWFTGMGAVLRNDADTWLWVAATSAETLAAVRATLPGDWMCADRES